MALGLSFEQTVSLIRALALLAAVILAAFVLFPESGGVGYYDKNLCVTYQPTIKLIQNQTLCTVACQDLTPGRQPIPHVTTSTSVTG